MFWDKITEIMILWDKTQQREFITTQSTFADEPQTSLSSSINSINKVKKPRGNCLIWYWLVSSEGEITENIPILLENDYANIVIWLFV